MQVIQNYELIWATRNHEFHPLMYLTNLFSSCDSGYQDPVTNLWTRTIFPVRMILFQLVNKLGEMKTADSMLRTQFGSTENCFFWVKNSEQEKSIWKTLAFCLVHLVPGRNKRRASRRSMLVVWPRPVAHYYVAEVVLADWVDKLWVPRTACRSDQYIHSISHGLKILFFHCLVGLTFHK